SAGLARLPGLLGLLIGRLAAVLGDRSPGDALTPARHQERARDGHRRDRRQRALGTTPALSARAHAAHASDPEILLSQGGKGQYRRRKVRPVREVWRFERLDHVRSPLPTSSADPRVARPYRRERRAAARAAERSR